MVVGVLEIVRLEIGRQVTYRLALRRHALDVRHERADAEHVPRDVLVAMPGHRVDGHGVRPWRRVEVLDLVNDLELVGPLRGAHGLDDLDLGVTVDEVAGATIDVLKLVVDGVEIDVPRGVGGREHRRVTPL
jgi:hypothetical protein